MTGYCALKRAGVEHCSLCGLAHYGTARTCPHLSSETQVRLMLDALKTSTESRESIEAARSYLRGVIGDLVRKKKRQKELQMARHGPVLPLATPGSQTGPPFGQFSS